MIKLRSILEDIGNDNGKTFYFAYGSNMDVESFEQKYKTAKALRLAYLQDYQLFFDKYSENDSSAVADIRPKKDSKVFGILYKIDPSEIGLLDKQEGGYKKLTTKVYDANGNVYEAFSYTVIKKNNIEVIPSIQYIHKIVVGLKDGMALGPVENNPLQSDLYQYIKRVTALNKEAGLVGEDLGPTVTPEFEKLSITNIKETPTYRKASVMWNGKLIGYVVYSKEKQKHIAMSDGSREFDAKAFNDEESAINYLKQFSSFTIPITVGGGSEEGSYQSYGY
jgi:gamma-glutamylcyclotransferase (GGCT)/AIG2-like uncharacterized protein YtfP